MAISHRTVRHTWILVALMLVAGLAVALKAQVAQAQIPQFKLSAADAEAGDNFGYSVSVSGDTAVVGAVMDADSGSAYVFTRNGSIWTQQGKMIAADAAEYDGFGCSVSVSGDTALIGTPWDDDGGLNSGSAYVFTRSGGVWTQQAELSAADAAAGDEFGCSASVSGDTAIVGAYYDDDAGGDSGSAYVFTRIGSTWTQQQKLTAADAEAGDNFGYSVSVSGDTAVVGAVMDADSGSAYVFTRNGSIWTQQGRIIGSDAAPGDQFGYSVSVSGDTAVAGAYRHDGVATDSGSAYVFTRSGSAWIQQAKLTASDAAVSDCFGVSVSISGDMAVIGAHHDDGVWDQSGSAYVFARSGSAWIQQAKLTASDAAAYDEFAYSVAIDGGRIIAGAGQKDNPEADSGAAYVFEVGHTVLFETDGTAGAWIDGATTQMVVHESDCTAVEAKAPPGRSFVKWTKVGADYSTGNPLIVTNVTEDMTLTAVFEVSASVGEWLVY